MCLAYVIFFGKEQKTTYQSYLENQSNASVVTTVQD